jgi:hypothetical protein
MLAGQLSPTNKPWEHSLTHNKTCTEEQAVRPLQQATRQVLKLSADRCNLNHFKMFQAMSGWYFISRRFSVTRLHSDDDRISEWRRTGKDLVESCRGLILRYCPSIRLEGLRKITKISIRIAGHRGLESKPGPPKYELGVLTTRPRRSVIKVMGLQIIASRPPWMTSLAYHISRKSTERFKGYPHILYTWSQKCL